MKKEIVNVRGGWMGMVSIEKRAKTMSMGAGYDVVVRIPFGGLGIAKSGAALIKRDIAPEAVR